MACDPFWNKTVLALKFDGTNGSTTFTDEKGHTLTANGNAQISTAQSKFGGASAYFVGTGDYISAADSFDFSFGTGDFTIEAWVYLLSNRIHCFVDTRVGSVTTGVFFGTTSANILNLYTNGNVIVGATPIPLSTWTHVALTRSSGVLNVFVNGVRDGTSSTALTLTDIKCRIGSDWQSLPFMHGYIDTLRITKAARYTANFTPDTSAFVTSQCAISGTIKDATGANAKRLVRVFRRDTATLIGQTLSDATTGAYSLPSEYTGEHFVMAHDIQSDDFYWDKVILACHFDGANGGTTFTDEKGHALTRAGTPQISTAQSKFGGASARFSDSNNGSENISSTSTDFDLSGVSEFTVEAFVRVTTWDTYSYFVSYGNGGTRGWSLGLTASNLWFYWSTNGSSSGDSTAVITFNFSLNTWYHVAVTKKGSSLYFFVDGVLIGTATFTQMYSSAGPFRVGIFMDYTGISHCFRGYLDHLRITKGVARYTANFTPPAQAFSTTNATGTGTENAVVLDRVLPV